MNCVNCDTETCEKGCSEIKLFGVQISMRKCKSMDNLEAAAAAAAAADEPSGYLSDGFLHQSSKSLHRKRGKPWTEEEHRSFLEGLDKLGKGDWKGIATKFVPSRNSSQVASHAQKYFSRLNLAASNKKRRRTSVFDIPPTHNNNNNANQPSSQVSQSNNIAEECFYNANSPPAASKSIAKPKPPPNNVPTTSERPPLSPVQPYWLPESRGLIYVQPRVSGFTKQAVMPRNYWSQVQVQPQPQVVYLPTQTPNVFRQGWFQAASLPSATNNQQVNLNIRNLKL